MIEARNITVSRAGSSVLRGVDLDVATGEVVGIVGPNGCGKTTLMRVLYGALRPQHGTVRIDGDDINTMSRRRIAQKVSIVPQGLPHDHGQTVADLVILGRLCQHDFLTSYRQEDFDALEVALAQVGLSGWGQRRLSDLSGGEVQRAMIARALCQAAPCLLLDEPTNHLDLHYQHNLLSLLREIGCTVVLVLHDLNLAARYCDRIHLLHEGRLQYSGPPKNVLRPDALSQVYQIDMSRIETSGGHVHLIVADAPA